MSKPLDRAREIVGVAARHANEVDVEGRFPVEAITALKEARLLGAFVPAIYGGDGASMSEIGSICHILGRHCGSTALIYAMHQIQTACIVRHGGCISWQGDMLRRLADEQWLLASATTEAATGGDLSRSNCALQTDGSYFAVVKQGAVISYGNYADAVLVTARRTPDALPSDQVLAVLLRRQFELTILERWNALGMRGTCSNTYLFQGAGHVDQILPCSYGDIQSDTMVPFSHLVWSCVWLGIAEGAVSRARRYLQGRAGTDKTMAQTRLVDATAMLQQVKANIVAGLALYETQLASANPVVSFDLIARMNNLKLSVSTVIVQVIQQALLICGISGYRNDSEFSVGRHLRDAHSAALMIGNDRITGSMGKMLMMQRADADLLA